MKFATFFYPGYYSCEKRNRAAGSPINEWSLLHRSARSVFVDTPPIIPSLGFTDCSCPTVLAQEAALAHHHGVDAFVFNYYFDGSDTELGEPLAAFAQLDTDLEFAINLCCHMPKRKLPFGISDGNVAPFSFWTEEQFELLAMHLCDQYLTKPNYLRCAGRAIITLYHINALWYLYGPEGLTRRIEILRRVSSCANIQLHIIGLFSVVGGWNRLPNDVHFLPFDSYSYYVVLPDFKSDQPVQSFPQLARKWLALMGEQTRVPLSQSLVPCVGAGWNATNRGKSGYNPNRDGLQFPYYPIVVDDDPITFHNYLSCVVREALSSNHYSSELLFLGPWNEWSEGCYLLPDKRFGLGKLEAVQQVKNTLKLFHNAQLA